MLVEGGFARHNGIVLAMWICGSGVTTPFVVLFVASASTFSFPLMLIWVWTL